MNSTKAWTALFAVVDGLKPRADRLNEKLRLEREAYIAGSKEIGPDGAGWMTAGFAEAKGLLLELAGYQQLYSQSKGRYALTRRELDAVGFTLGGPDFELVVEGGGREYRAWAKTPGDYVFGVAGRDGERAAWPYEGKAAHRRDRLRRRLAARCRRSRAPELVAAPPASSLEAWPESAFSAA